MNVLSKKILKLIEEIDDALENYLSIPTDSPTIITNAMRYSLFSGGKRLRPILMMETCSCFGGDKKEIMPLACSIEMIHTYSLIHDDLPALDNDDLRRGRPTNHIVYGENMAILAGDALLNYAYEIGVEGLVSTEISKQKRYMGAYQLLINSAGINGMIGGQVADILGETNDVGEYELNYIHKNKTGALLSAAVLCGGLIGNCTNEEFEYLKSFSEKIGLAFQIVDDILDVIGEENVFGKPIGSDVQKNKTTFVSLYGLESSQQKVFELKEEALEILSKINRKTEFLEELTVYMCDRNK